MHDTTLHNPNPWLSVWVAPRRTIERIVNNDPRRWVLLIAVLSGISQALDGAVQQNVGDDMGWPFILVSAAIAGSISGLLGLFVGSWLLRLTGPWLGGRASALELRAAIAWGSVPIVWGLSLWIALLGLFGQETFASEKPLMAESTTLWATYLAIAIADVVVSVWAFVTLLLCVAQVQGFSAWRALGNLVAAVAVVAVPALLLMLLLSSSA